MVWLTEFGLVYSIRYVIIISVPLVVVITEGIFESWVILKKLIPNLSNDIKTSFITLIALMGMFNFYPTIPLLFLIKFPLDPVQINDGPVEAVEQRAARDDARGDGGP